MQLISQSEIYKRNFRIFSGTRLKRKNMGNSHAMFEIYWQQKQQQTKAHYIENTQLHKDNQLDEELADESEERNEPSEASTQRCS